MQTAWSSWVEAAPETARAIGAEEGQLVTVESDHGALDVSLLLNPRLRPGVVAMPLGQGHTHYGRYANGVGVNAAALLDPAPETPAADHAGWERALTSRRARCAGRCRVCRPTSTRTAARLPAR